jgi:hypothetical protein
MCWGEKNFSLLSCEGMKKVLMSDEERKICKNK